MRFALLLICSVLLACGGESKLDEDLVGVWGLESIQKNGTTQIPKASGFLELLSGKRARGSFSRERDADGTMVMTRMDFSGTVSAKGSKLSLDLKPAAKTMEPFMADLLLIDDTASISYGISDGGSTLTMTISGKLGGVADTTYLYTLRALSTKWTLASSTKDKVDEKAAGMLDLMPGLDYIKEKGLNGQTVRQTEGAYLVERLDDGIISLKLAQQEPKGLEIPCDVTTLEAKKLVLTCTADDNVGGTNTFVETYSR